MLRSLLMLSLALPPAAPGQTSASANPKGNLLVIKAAMSGGATYTCTFDTSRTSPQACTQIGRMNHRFAGFQFRLLARRGDRAELGFRSRVPHSAASGPGRMSVEEVESEPQTQYWFQPGRTLRIEMPCAGTLAVTGEWRDHKPAD